MEFEKRIVAFRKMLFVGYIRGDKITEEDWHDEATELALTVKYKGEDSVVGKKISDVLTAKFEHTDGFTDFDELGLKMAEKLNPYLD